MNPEVAAAYLQEVGCADIITIPPFSREGGEIPNACDAPRGDREGEGVEGNDNYSILFSFSI
jgi:hypothetical protein